MTPPVDFFGYYEAGPHGTPTSTFVLFKCSIVEADGTETFAENCTFFIDACQRLAQSPDISSREAAELLDTAGRQIRQKTGDKDLASEVKAVIEPLRERNEELKRKLEQRNEDESRQAAETGRRHMQEAMEMGQGIFCQSYATLHPGHFSKFSKGMVQDTPSFTRQIPGPVLAPVQLPMASPAMFPNQKSNANNQATNINQFYITDDVSTRFAASFQRNQEQGPFLSDRVDAEPHFNVAAPPFIPEQQQSRFNQGQGVMRRKRNKESQKGQSQAHGPIDREFRQFPIGKERLRDQSRNRHSKQANAHLVESPCGSSQAKSQASFTSKHFGSSYDQAYGHSAQGQQSISREQQELQFGQIQAKSQIFQNLEFYPVFEAQRQRGSADQGLSDNFLHARPALLVQHNQISPTMYDQQSSSQYPRQEQLVFDRINRQPPINQIDQVQRNGQSAHEGLSNADTFQRFVHGIPGRHDGSSMIETGNGQQSTLRISRPEELEIDQNRVQLQLYQVQRYRQSEHYGLFGKSHHCDVAPDCNLGPPFATMIFQSLSYQDQRLTEPQIDQGHGQPDFEQVHRHEQSEHQGCATDCRHCLLAPHRDLSSQDATMAVQPSLSQDQRLAQSQIDPNFGQFSSAHEEPVHLRSSYQCPLEFPHNCTVACESLLRESNTIGL
ncbi:hypothetical protein E2P81_ATG00858 [Venturia nashicola]|nr:hypothetical protein E2P81_ATG00858 [Venturia nashicola]